MRIHIHKHAQAHAHTHTRSEIRHKLPQLLIIYFRLVETCTLYNIIIDIRQNSSAVYVGRDGSGCMYIIIQLETSASILQSKISVNSDHFSTSNHKSAYHVIFHNLSFSSNSSSFLFTATCEQ